MGALEHGSMDVWDYGTRKLGKLKLIGKVLSISFAIFSWWDDESQSSRGSDPESRHQRVVQFEVSCNHGKNVDYHLEPNTFSKWLEHSQKTVFKTTKRMKF